MEADEAGGGVVAADGEDAEAERGVAQHDLGAIATSRNNDGDVGHLPIPPCPSQSKKSGSCGMPVTGEPPASTSARAR